MSNTPKIEIFRVPGVSCDHCVRTIQQEVGALEGVRRVQVNLADKSVRVEHTGQTTVQQIIRAIDEAGYDEIAVLV